jgi:hypothetical protein
MGAFPATVHRWDTYVGPHCVAKHDVRVLCDPLAPKDGKYHGEQVNLTGWRAFFTTLAGSQAFVMRTAEEESQVPISLADAKALIAKGRSTETHEYVQQLFALDAHPTLAKALVGQWPSEATSKTDRPLAIAQTVAAIIGAGPYYIANPLLTCGQVMKAHGWAYRNPSWNLNPTYLAALNRAAKVAKPFPADMALPWGEKSPVQLVNNGSFGDTPVSGYYGTGDGPVPG